MPINGSADRDVSPDAGKELADFREEQIRKLEEENAKLRDEVHNLKLQVSTSIIATGSFADNVSLRRDYSQCRPWSQVLIINSLWTAPPNSTTLSRKAKKRSPS